MVSSTNIRVSWRGPLGGEVVTGFEVSYTPVNSCPATPGGRRMVEGRTITQFTLTGLQPFTNYSIYVRANASQGLGPASMPAVFEMTQADGKYCDMHSCQCLSCDVSCSLSLCVPSSDWSSPECHCLCHWKHHSGQVDSTGLQRQERGHPFLCGTLWPQWRHEL